MNNLGFSLLTAALFGAGFGGTVYYVNTPGSSPFTTAPIACDVQRTECLAALRAQGERLFGRGDRAGGEAAYRRAALAGDFRAAFQLGWYHEEAYRKAVGKKLDAGSGPPEEQQPGASAMPRGPEFETLLKRYEEVPAGPQRALAERSLAFLWYARAAAGGFGPAMNNLGAMYQFGLMGGRDRMQATTWYQRAAKADNPVARVNVALLEARYGGDCDGMSMPAAFTAGFSSPAADLEDDIVTRTRFRGRQVPDGIRRLFTIQGVVANADPNDNGIGAALGIIGAMNGNVLGTFGDGNQDWDDAEEAAATKGKLRDCFAGPRGGPGAGPGAADRRKLERLREIQDDNDRARTAQLRRRW